MYRPSLFRQMVYQFRHCFKAVMIGLIAISSTMVFAGPGGSSGGNVRVCFNDEMIVANIKARGPERLIQDEEIPFIESVEAYDLYALKKKLGQNIPLMTSADNESSADFLLRLEKRFQKNNPFIASLFASGRYYLPEKNMEPSAAPLFRIPDEKDVYSAENNKCVIATAIAHIQRGSKFSLQIDSRLMDPRIHPLYSQKVLLAHERIYVNFSSTNPYRLKHQYASGSSQTRDLLGMILSTTGPFSYQQVNTWLEENGFQPEEQKSILTHKKLLAASLVDFSVSNKSQLHQQIENTANHQTLIKEYNNLLDQCPRIYAVLKSKMTSDQIDVHLQKIDATSSNFFNFRSEALTIDGRYRSTVSLYRLFAETGNNIAFSFSQTKKKDMQSCQEMIKKISEKATHEVLRVSENLKAMHTLGSDSNLQMQNEIIETCRQNDLALPDHAWSEIFKSLEPTWTDLRNDSSNLDFNKTFYRSTMNGYLPEETSSAPPYYRYISAWAAPSTLEKAAAALKVIDYEF